MQYRPLSFSKEVDFTIVERLFEKRHIETAEIVRYTSTYKSNPRSSILKWSEYGIRSQKNLSEVILSLTSCVTLDESLNFSEHLLFNKMQEFGSMIAIDFSTSKALCFPKQKYY